MNPETHLAQGSADFGGLRVVTFESRMARETAAMIERRGGAALVAPAMREVPLEEHQAAFEFADRLLGGGFDVVIFLTGTGVRVLFQMMETRHGREALVAALGRTTVVARGPKPERALREVGLEPAIVTRDPNTWRELLAEVCAGADLAGRRVAVQEYGVPNRDLIAGLEARGASVTAVPVYRWALPLDRVPLRAALSAVAGDRAEVALFTSSAQVANVLQSAEAEGLGEQVRRGLAAMAVGSIGPVCSEELRRHGISPDFEPAHPKLGQLVKEAAEKARAIVAQKRARPARIEAGPQPARRPSLEGADALRSPRWDLPFLRACRRRPTPYTPIWLMRQAGRYMPEYRRIRDRLGFLEMCMRPEIAAEVTVLAVERLSADAAIIFADLLLPLVPLGVGLHYEKGDGPIIDRPVRSAASLEQLPPFDAAALAFVGEAIRMTHAALGGRVPLIGFAGAPFTLASYLIEGGASQQYRATKTLMYKEPETWHRLMEFLSRATIAYLDLQVEAGADAVQLFDSWVGSLGPDDYRRFVLPHTASVIAAVKPGVPVIHFGTITASLLELMREAGGDVIGLDWRVDLAEAWARLGDGVAVQGNLDPVALFAEIPEIRSRARAILDQAGGRPGHIFNLGHGVLPETPVDHVVALVDAVHEMSRRQARA